MFRTLPGVASFIYISSYTTYWPTALLIFSLHEFHNATAKYRRAIATYRIELIASGPILFGHAPLGSAIYRLIRELNETRLTRTPREITSSPTRQLRAFFFAAGRPVEGSSLFAAWQAFEISVQTVRSKLTVFN